jgi:hypothetical protein
MIASFCGAGVEMGSATVSGCLPISVYDGSQSLPIAGTDPDELQAPIDDTVREVRAERASFGRRRAGPGGPAHGRKPTVSY